MAHPTHLPFSGFATVILDRGIDQPLDYGIASSDIERVSIGMRVLVPVRKRWHKGVIVAIKRSPSTPEVQPIAQLLVDESSLPPDLIELAAWLHRYYASPMRKILQTLLPQSIRKKTRSKKERIVKPLLLPKQLKKISASLRAKFPARATVLDILQNHPTGIPLSQLLKEGKVSKSPIDTLVREKILSLEVLSIHRSPLHNFPFFQSPPKRLTPEQREALDTIRSNLEKNRFQVHLIHGVTGSGKTEIYLRAIEGARKKNRGAILLVPEIALTSQMVERLKSRFTEKLGILHHRLSDGERSEIWHEIQRGEVSIVVGARSCIFSPVQNLGLIIVDEEHESSYKQMEEGPCYHARDVAIVRGKLSHAVTLLGSATPSLETYAKAKEGKYILHTLTKRAIDAERPEMQLIDMGAEWERAEGPSPFSHALIQGIKKRYARGEQTLLFLNRRGYHTFQFCPQCEQAIRCPHCDITLTFHKKSHCLACHLCLHTLSPPPIQCPHCRHSAPLQYKGIGTEQVERRLRALLREIRTLRIDGDTTRQKGSHDRLLKQFRAGKADVLIGTQMIAKGLHFPSVTLVGILNADGALNLPDFRAFETAFQLLTQVAGRSGRGPLKGEVIIQTHLKHHPIFPLIAQENYPAFFEREIATRKLLDFPPYTRLAKLTFSGPDAEKTLAFAKRSREKILSTLPHTFSIYPLIPSGHSKIRDRHRFKLLIKGRNISRHLSQLRASLRCPREMHLLIDIDPIDLFH